MDVYPLAGPPHLAAVGCVDPRDALDQDRLAGAVITRERGHLPGGDLEIDVRERLDRTETLADALEA
jgi:hypothetical protein